jgi:hypothetical protein
LHYPFYITYKIKSYDLKYQGVVWEKYRKVDLFYDFKMEKITSLINMHIDVGLIFLDDHFQQRAAYPSYFETSECALKDNKYRIEALFPLQDLTYQANFEVTGEYYLKFTYESTLCLDSSMMTSYWINLYPIHKDIIAKAIREPVEEISLRTSGQFRKGTNNSIKYLLEGEITFTKIKNHWVVSRVCVIFDEHVGNQLFKCFEREICQLKIMRS